ncbi:MAG: phosphotransferase [Magnetococcales bacterium]|nr:phosphotransferase [Magnetococcales bacterium]
MSLMDTSDLDRSALAFLSETLGEGLKIEKVAGDASFRSYYRVLNASGYSSIFMNAPPEKEDSEPYINVTRFLLKHGIRVPEIIEARLSDGHLLISDFGDTTLSQALEQGVDPEPLYKQAVDALIDMQATPEDGSCIAHQRPFDRTLQRTELALFTDWFLAGILDCPLTDDEYARFDTAFHRLLDGTLSQPFAFVHRDYHCRNLMVDRQGLGIIDFQDAVMGPVTYDLASLLRDCYVAWDAGFRHTIMNYWYAQAVRRLGYDRPWTVFERDFDMMAIQRNLKAIGIFGRLSLRDGKHGYLQDIPRTMGYVRETLVSRPELADLAELIDECVPDLPNLDQRLREAA